MMAKRKSIFRRGRWSVAGLVTVACILPPAGLAQTIFLDGGVPSGPYACRKDNGIYYAVAEVINLQTDGRYTFRSNREPDATRTGEFEFDPGSGEIQFSSGILEAVSGQVAQDATNGSFYMQLSQGHGQCYIYEGDLPF